MHATTCRARHAALPSFNERFLLVCIEHGQVVVGLRGVVLIGLETSLTLYADHLLLIAVFSLFSFGLPAPLLEVQVWEY